MVYQKDSKFVAVITCNGKILRDFKNDEDNYQVKLPFGSEYGIRLKNLNTTRVAFSVHIDGEDVLGGSRIILDPNESHDLEGFMVDNVVKNRFKFIEKTKKISDHRGDKIDDGMIRIEYQFEKKPAVREQPTIKPYRYEPWTPISKSKRIITEEWNSYNTTMDSFDNDSLGDTPKGNRSDNPIRPGDFQSEKFTGGEIAPQGIMRSLNRRISDGNPNSHLGNTVSLSSNTTPKPDNEDGITVKGSQTHVNYKNGWLGEMEEAKYVMVLTLSGYKEKDKKKVEQAITVKQKVECETCGTKNKSSNKFCSDCGTCLV